MITTKFSELFLVQLIFQVSMWGANYYADSVFSSITF